MTIEGGKTIAEYTISQVATQLGRSSRVIKSHLDMGLVVPDEKPSRGRGKERKLSDKNRIEVGMVQVMLETTPINLKGIKMVMENVRERQDFFTDRDLGVIWDIVYAFQHQKDGPHGFYNVYEDDIGQFVPNEKSFASRNILGYATRDNFSCTLIMLGKIRNEAMKRLGVSL